jgi:hypothetical protein
MTDEEWVDQYDSPNVRPYKSCTQCSERKSCGSYDADCNWLCEDCYAEWEEKHDWDNLDFGTAEEPQCGLCGCSSDNGMWGEDGDMTEDVICDECDKRWCFDSDRDAYVLRGETLDT